MSVMSAPAKPGAKEKPDTSGAVGRARSAVKALRVLSQMRREARRVATDAERVALTGWCGWGPLAPMWAPKTKAWEQIAEEIRALLPAEDIDAGFRAIYNAFYTPREVAKAMWGLAGKLGFTGGRVLEPGCGAGVFMSTKPDGVDITGVEKDPASAAIAALLNPDATVVASAFESARLRGGYGLVIGNVPFGNVKVHDPLMDRDFRGSLHNYCIARSVKELAPGGFAVLLTSRYTLDATSEGFAFRSALAKMADFVGAIRLPNKALGGGTDIVSDIIVLRRRDGASSAEPYDGWLSSAQDWERFKAVPVNSYWLGERGAGMVLGDMVTGRTSQYGLTIEVKPRDSDGTAAAGIGKLGGLIARQAAKDGLMWVAPPGTTDFAGITGDDLAAKGWYEGEFRRVNGKLMKVKKGEVVEARPTRELLALLKLRDLAADLVALEADHDLPDAKIEPMRRDVRAAYEAYVKKFGYLNRSRLVDGKTDPETGIPQPKRIQPPMEGFRHDPKAPIVFALEMWDDETHRGKPAPILTARQNRPVTPPTHTDDPHAALGWSLDRFAEVNVAYIAEMLKTAPEAVPGMLGDAVYCRPDTRQWVTASQYGSGNVRKKHQDAVAAAKVDPAFKRNVDYLAAVLPKWRGAGEFTVSLGAPWLSTGDVAQFVRELLGQRPAIRRLKESGQWEVAIDGHYRESIAATSEWGTGDIDAYRLIQDALNGKVPEVRYKLADGGTAKDPDATLLATTKQQTIKDRFTVWVWEDADRAERLVKTYNWECNNLAPLRFPGGHVTVTGLAPWFKPYDHQKEWVARAVTTPACLNGHSVGGGKTAAIAMTVMKLRQTGMVNKPMIVVPNHLVEQMDREMRQLFPAARILTASSETIAANRRSFAARVTTQVWDAIIINHSAFDVLPVLEDTEVRYLDAQRELLESSIREAAPDGRLEGRMLKEAAKKLDRLQANIADLRHRARGYDNTVTFEQLGVDYLAIDEFQRYKNLAVICRTDGFSIGHSKRATDLDTKLMYLSQRGSGRYASFYTGTPISNTMLEMYVMLHYSMPERLERMGMATADPWAQAFVQMETAVEVTVDGGQFRLKTQPRRFVNARQLRMMLSQVADIRTREQLKLKVPAADHRTVVVKPTRTQRIYSGALVRRVEMCKGKRHFGKGEDNMLKICNDGRWMATDPGLVGLTDKGAGKLTVVAREMVSVWKEHPDELQIGFCDIGTPSADGTQTYGRLRKLLIEMGMDPRRIRFVHSAKTDAAKAALFAECRAGKVSVILGSTDTLGTGTNIQDRVIAMHHIDAPWRPADVEQREGRGIRPKNRHSIVRVYRYVTERTFDAYLWQMLTRKITFISQILSGDLTSDDIEDIGADDVNSYASVKAAATGQPLLMEQAQVLADIKKLDGLRASHAGTLNRLRRGIPKNRQGAESLDAAAKAWEAIARAATELGEDAGEQLHKLAQGYRYTYPRGTVGGVTVTFTSWRIDAGDDVEYEPEMRVDGGAGYMPVRCFGHWEPDEYLAKLKGVLRKARTEGPALRKAAQEKRDEVQAAEEMLTREFAQQDELTAAKARLDQIDAELHAAAVKVKESGEQAEVEDDDDSDDAVTFEVIKRGVFGTVHDPVAATVDEVALDAFFGGLKSLLEEEVDEAFAGLAQFL